MQTTGKLFSDTKLDFAMEVGDLVPREATQLCGRGKDELRWWEAAIVYPLEIDTVTESLEMFVRDDMTSRVYGIAGKVVVASFAEIGLTPTELGLWRVDYALRPLHRSHKPLLPFPTPESAERIKALMDRITASQEQYLEGKTASYTPRGQPNPLLMAQVEYVLNGCPKIPLEG